MCFLGWRALLEQAAPVSVWQLLACLLLPDCTVAFNVLFSRSSFLSFCCSLPCPCLRHLHFRSHCILTLFTNQQSAQCCVKAWLCNLLDGGLVAEALPPPACCALPSQKEMMQSIWHSGCEQRLLWLSLGVYIRMLCGSKGMEDLMSKSFSPTPMTWPFSKPSHCYWKFNNSI